MKSLKFGFHKFVDHYFMKFVEMVTHKWGKQKLRIVKANKN